MNLLALFDGWFWHPLTGLGYQFWSGIGSDIGELTIVAALFTVFRSHKCHEPWCFRAGRNTHAKSGTRWCHRHVPAVLRREHPDPTALLPRRERKQSRANTLTQ